MNKVVWSVPNLLIVVVEGIVETLKAHDVNFSAKTCEDLVEAEKALLELARLHPEWAPRAKQFIATELNDRDAFLRKMDKVRDDR